MDNAQPILTDVGDLHFASHSSGRLLVTYISPLGNDTWVRLALSPTGPFSAPHRLLRCETAPGEFCVSVVRHPFWEQAPQDVVLSRQRASFDRMAPDRRLPQVATVKLPPLLS